MPVTRVEVRTGEIRALLLAPGVQAEVAAQAERVAARARSLAPRRSGRYARGIRVQTGRGRTRARAEVIATAPYSLEVEARHGVLRRSV